MSALEHIKALMDKRKEYMALCNLDVSFTENDLDTLALVSIAESLGGIDISLARIADAADANVDMEQTAKMVDLFRGAGPV